ncbi:hypothetical protein WA026_006562 [Henosepilachna vigintioctopunctata]|uniref:Uncharacterized protein n=1 Tax=Henosepilachna vigintioctopunctata TaxID=420089 RepID=A0AAW1U748_9CUCU
MFVPIEGGEEEAIASGGPPPVSTNTGTRHKQRGRKFGASGSLSDSSSSVKRQVSEKININLLIMIC